MSTCFAQAWAFGKLKYVPAAGTSLPTVIAAAALRRMGEFSPQNLSNLVWSFVYMHHVDEALLAAAARYVVARVGEFKPQELANIVWAFASLGYRDEHMVGGRLCLQRAGDCWRRGGGGRFLRAAGVVQGWQRLESAGWAMVAGWEACCRAPDAYLRTCSCAASSRRLPQLHVVASQAQRIAPLFKEQELSNVLWALGKMGLRHRPDVLESLMVETRTKLPAFLPQVRQ